MLTVSECNPQVTLSRGCRYCTEYLLPQISDALYKSRRVNFKGGTEARERSIPVLDFITVLYSIVNQRHNGVGV